MLAVRGLTKFFGGLGAVVNLSFQVKEGEIFGLVGVSGSGKTSLSTADPELVVLWKDLIELTKKNHTSWIEIIQSGLQRYGYTIELLT
jgi:ABC-type branched-subunit amino acid transport system ATPase component